MGLNTCEVGANPLRWVGNAVDCASDAIDAVAGTDVCVDLGDPQCESIAEQHPELEHRLEQVAVASAVVACASTAFAVCAAGAFLVASGLSVHDAANGNTEAIVANYVIAWAGVALLGAPVALAGLPAWAEGLLGFFGALLTALPELFANDC